MHNLHNEEIYIVFFASLLIGEGEFGKKRDLPEQKGKIEARYRLFCCT